MEILSAVRFALLIIYLCKLSERVRVRLSEYSE